MAFRKRNIALTRPSTDANPAATSSPPSSFTPAPQTPGTRPSPIDGRLTTSTGTSSLDSILAGHAGFPLGNSILIEENGTTDYAGTLLRFYAAEGVVQGHKVHVIGPGEAWGRELPGIAVSKEEKKKAEGEKMKIAWRYEGLGEFGARESVGGNKTASTTNEDETPFCHTFDLAARLTLPVGTLINYISIPDSPTTSPFIPILQNLQRQLASSTSDTIHRLVIPSLISPALYPYTASHPHAVLQFLHALRALLRQYPTQLTALLTLPLELFPRHISLVRWMELFSDGVIELTPFPHTHLADRLAQSGGTRKEEERPQGMVNVHKLPVFHERGGGVRGGLGEDLAFTVSRRKFLIAKFSLPPLEGDTSAQQEGGAVAGVDKRELEF